MNKYIVSISRFILAVVIAAISTTDLYAQDRKQDGKWTFLPKKIILTDTMSCSDIHKVKGFEHIDCSTVGHIHVDLDQMKELVAYGREQLNAACLKELMREQGFKVD